MPHCYRLWEVALRREDKYSIIEAKLDCQDGAAPFLDLFNQVGKDFHSFSRL